MTTATLETAFATTHVPCERCCAGDYSVDPALDNILENARQRYEASQSAKCPVRDPVSCRQDCRCRECFRHFYYPVQLLQAACVRGPECPRFRELHTVVHTASAAKHVELLLDRAANQGFVDVERAFAGARGVAASYGCGGAADLVGCLGWASRNYGTHRAASLELRGCDVVRDWLPLGVEAVSFAVRRSPWAGHISYRFRTVSRRPTAVDLELFGGADIVLFSWVLSLLEAQGSLVEVFHGIVGRLRPGAIVVITDRWEPSGFNATLDRLLVSTKRLESAWGVGDFDQRRMQYTFSPEIRSHWPRGKFRASGVVARVQ